MKKRACVVVAHKYNDIFYAINTFEFEKSDYKILVTVEKGHIVGRNFPFKEIFDHHLNVRNKFSIAGLLLICKLYHNILKNKILVDVMFISNPVLVINQYLHKIFGKPRMILLEDGLMNYNEVKESNSLLKKIVQKIFGISNSGIYNKIETTYLSQPDLGKYYFGELKKINNNSFNFASKLDQDIQGKKIFVGGDYYRYKFMSINQYCTYVNAIIKEFDIDLYLPHAFSNNNETINCNVLNLNSKSLTLEMLASNYTFSIYSFGSTCAFTCKNINPIIGTSFFVLKEYSSIVFDFLKEHSDEIYSFDNNLRIIENNGAK
jgi:hypothetical protein